MATLPKSSYAAPWRSVSLAVSCVVFQPPLGLTNTYAAPSLALPPTVAPQAPTAIVLPSPLMLIILLKPSLGLPSDAVNSALNFDVVFQPLFGFWNTYTFPCPLHMPLCEHAPITMVFPLIPTDPPNPSAA